MARTPGRYRPPMGSRDSAEAAFKSATTKPPEEPAPKAPSIPGPTELVSLRIPRDVLDYSRRTGPAGRTGSSRRCARRRAFEALRPAVGFRENGSAAVQAGPDVLFGERLRVRRPEDRLAEGQRFGVRLRRPATLGDDDERLGLSLHAVSLDGARSPARVGLSSDLLPGDFTGAGQPLGSRPLGAGLLEGSYFGKITVDVVAESPPRYVWRS